MTTTTAPMSWARQAEAWLDGFGKGGWIAAMVLAFILFWPLGLGLLAYMIWGKQMFGKSCRKQARHGAAMMRSSGNTAFDSYKSDMLRRLEDEQAAFDSFLHRLREAKDKTEFDQFMEENRRKRDAGQPAGDPS
ncbi:DUF2852 domain-containing protein [Roseinatronobacter alkalisoli]|uniref:DUF2852 domain-containing protein n=1 Tax=Roseinatronobacter alkalisoli TaxID=3028235 RepID=A0ABT5T9N7_9RHOB|nr:DUF2852 domain-containing protein [Roseinatronobacter sp. HJB301]MDD7971691.1 DUF2852 domain-containing protein [Roseinatronobacter sp. HJB301]